MNFKQIQEALQSERLDGWLFYDFRKSNPIAYQILSIPLNSFFSRRWFYFVPAYGTPTALVSAVESHVLNSLPGEQRIFRTWQEMRSHLEDCCHTRQAYSDGIFPHECHPLHVPRRWGHAGTGSLL